ncbi:hypothetical protein L7F22_016791 [Adiantum nelumboides]|nr:hypothetical protein [Adiantum nelumboides]
MLVTRFLTVWEVLQKSGKQSIYLAVWTLLWRDILITGLAAFLKGVGILSGPIFLYYFVDDASGNVRFKYEGVVLVVSLAITKIVENFAQRHSRYFGVRILGAKLQSILMAAVYQKLLTLSSIGRQRYTSGEIVNLAVVDAFRISELAFRLHWGWVVPMVHLCGKLAYVSQSAWIQSMTVRDNILFGESMDEAHYKCVVHACALEDDMKSFTHGDLTEIGERGTNLSGGQKQRIQLARAVYNDADIHLLDDPFSAVDAHTSSHLFRECVMEALKDKTIVLVTHQMEYLPFVDSILVMHDGEIKQAGNYSDLLAAGDAFKKLVSAHETALHMNEVASVDQIVTSYVSYVQISGSQLVPVVLVLSQILFSGFQLFSNIWLAKGLSNQAVSSEALIEIYCVLSLGCMVAFAMRSQMILMFGLQASRSFFTKLMSRIMKAPIGFFDDTPSGRILNRVSMDTSVIDLDIPFTAALVLGMVFDFLCIIIVVCIVTWQMILVVVPALALTQFVQHYSEDALEEQNKINATEKAPIVNKSAETLIGSVTIRAFKQSERFKRQSLELIDKDVCAYIYNFAVVEWKVLYIKLCSIFMLVMAACFIIFQGNILGGFTGLTVTYALAFGNSLVIFCVHQTFLAVFIVSVERIRQYLGLPKEAPAVIESYRPPRKWPQRGEVLLDNLNTRLFDKHVPNSPTVYDWLVLSALDR